MLLILLAYLSGVLTILSPCVLPVLPFVFSRAGQPFARSVLPLLAGMVLSFALAASLAAVGGGWVVTAHRWGRGLALAALAVSALSLLWRPLADRIARPFVAAGTRWMPAPGQPAGIGSSLLLGAATGLLWTPCAGPLLGLILTGAALEGASARSTALLLVYAGGAATALAAALLLGARVAGMLRRSLGAGEWLRRALGVAMLAGVVAIALGLDASALAALQTSGSGRLEQQLADRLLAAPSAAASAGPSTDPSNTGARHAAQQTAQAPSALPDLPDLGALPALDGATGWLNSPPLTAPGLRGRVVLIDFWTFGCSNCLRTLPHVRAWAERYQTQGLVVVGVHAPEFAFERDIDNLRQALQRLAIGYPVAVDNRYALWRAFGIRYWPTHVLVDAQGRLRYQHVGEGGEAQTEQAIRQLLAEPGVRAPGTTTTESQTGR